MGNFTSDGPYPTPDALVALRNSRLWEAHAQQSSGAQRDAAQRAAAQWSENYQMLMTTAPGKRAVPWRRDDPDKKWMTAHYVWLFLFLATIPIYFILHGFSII